MMGSPVFLWGLWGIVAQLQQSTLWPLPVYGAMALLAGVIAAAAWHWRAVASASAIGVVLALGLGLWSYAGWRAVQVAEQALPAWLDQQDVYVVGEVVALPRHSERGVQFVLAVESWRWRERSGQDPWHLRVGWWPPSTPQAHPTGPQGVATGQRWAMWLRLERPQVAANPNGFDSALWLWQQGIQATATVKIGTQWAVPERLPTSGVWGLDRLRAWARSAVQNHVGEGRAAGVLVALLVGDQAALGAQDWSLFRATGVTHVISISGGHVTMFSVLAVALVGRCWRSLGRVWPGLLWRVPVPWAAAWGGLGLAAAYALFSGWGIPAQRTVGMLCVFMALQVSGRRWPWPSVLGLVMWAVVLLDPWAWLQPGFWLSFVAVAVLLSSSWHGEAPVQGIWGHVLALWRTQWVVTVALAPWTWWFFGQVSLIGLCANLWVVPWVTFVVTPLAMLGTVWAPLWQAGAWCVDLLMWGLDWMARVPVAVWERPTLPLPLLGLAGGGALVLVYRWPLRQRLWGLCGLLPLCFWAPQRPLWGQFEVLAPDVGQGSAVVVRTARHTLVHDLGPGQGEQGAVARVLLPLLRGHGDRVDAVVASHDDTDHVAGLPLLLAAYPQARLWASYDTLPRAGRSAQRCQAGEAWSWDGVAFEWLHPQAADFSTDATDNARSCVLAVHSATGQRVVLTGDIGVAEEARLSHAHPHLAVDVLLAPHHGSATSSSRDWLLAWRPRWVWVQAGAHNRWGHPAPEVVRRYEELGLGWLSSVDCGAAFWDSRWPETVRCWHDRPLHYWETRAATP